MLSPASSSSSSFSPRISLSLIPPDSFRSRFYFPGCSVDGRVAFSGIRINTLYTALARCVRRGEGLGYYRLERERESGFKVRLHYLFFF